MYQSSGKVVYPNKNQGTLDLLANKEVDMVPAWADMALTQMKQGTLPESIRISQIDPSFTGNPVVLGIPSIGSNEDGAYAFIDYMLSAMRRISLLIPWRQFRLSITAFLIQSSQRRSRP